MGRYLESDLLSQSPSNIRAVAKKFAAQLGSQATVGKPAVRVQNRREESPGHHLHDRSV